MRHANGASGPRRDGPGGRAAGSAAGSAPALLLDERSDPDFRAHFGRALERSRAVDVALTHLRLTTLDLTAREVAGLDRLRLLLAEVSAEALDVEAHRILLHPSRARPLRRLRSLLAEGVIEIRSSPLAGWSPDFTVFSGPDGPFAALLGFHWFQRPFPHRGPALASLHGPEAARRVHVPFEEAWTRAHDIAPAIVGILRRPDVSQMPSRRRPGAARSSQRG